MFLISNNSKRCWSEAKLKRNGQKNPHIHCNLFLGSSSSSSSINNAQSQIGLQTKQFHAIIQFFIHTHSTNTLPEPSCSCPILRLIYKLFIQSFPSMQDFPESNIRQTTGESKGERILKVWCVRMREWGFNGTLAQRWLCSASWYMCKKQEKDGSSIKESNKVHHNVWLLHILFLIFSGSLIGYIILFPPEVVSRLVTKILFPAEVVLYANQNTREYEKWYPSDEPH